MKKIFIALSFLCISSAYAQVKIGNNPNTINANSVLELESSDKVLVVTRLSTTQRTAITPLNGAVVYDTDVECLFQFNNNTWSSLCTNNNTQETITSLFDNGNGTISYTDENRRITIINKASLIDNNDGTFTFSNGNGADITLDLSTTETLTSIVNNNNGTFTYTDENGGATTIDVKNLETLTSIALNPNNINLEYTDENGNLNEVDLSSFLDNTDAQTINLTDNILTLANGTETDTTADLSVFLDNTDEQNLTDASIDPATNILTIAIENGDPVTVDLSSFLDNTDEQDLTAATLDASNILTIEIQNGDPVTVDLSSFLDNTDAQTINLTDNILTLANGTAADTTADLSVFLDNTDEQNLTDASIDPATNILTIAIENGDPVTVDLSSFLDNTDEQDLTAATLDASNILTIEIQNGDPVTVDLSPLLHTGIEGSVFFAGADGNPTENNDRLFWDATNNRLGIGTNAPSNTLHVAGRTRTEGILNSDGTETTPSYRFNGDPNTGLYTPAADEIGFTVGGIQALRIDEIGNNTTVTINQTLDLDGQVLDENDAPGTPGQVLTATATGTVWASGNDADADATNELGVYTDVTTGNTNKIGEYQSSSTVTVVDVNETLTSFTQDDTTTATDPTATGEITYTDEAGTEFKAQTVSDDANNQIQVGSNGGAFYMSPVRAMGKINGNGTAAKILNATVTRLNTGRYQVTFTADAGITDADYIIQLTVRDPQGDGNDNYDVSYSAQTATGFIAEVGDNDNGGADRANRDFEFMFTVLTF